MTITRDLKGVSHVFATTDEGAYFGAGYAAARDRLFEMCWTRLMYQGRLSEYFGLGTNDENLLYDRRARALGWARKAQAEIDYMAAQPVPPQTLALLTAYADGVNRYITTAPPGQINPLFAANGIPITPWTPADCIGVWNRFGWMFWSGFGSEARLREDVDNLLAAGKTQGEIIAIYGNPLRCDDNAAVVKQGDVPGPIQTAMSQYAGTHGLSVLPNCSAAGSPGHFSHAWAVGGQHTVSGKAMLVADPRVGITIPSSLFEWHMKGATFDVRGVGVPGCPNILVGSTDNSAWGVTALFADQTDLFIMNVRPAGDRYWFQDAACPAGCWRTWVTDDSSQPIKVKASSDRPFRYRESPFGPVVTGNDTGLVVLNGVTHWPVGTQPSGDPNSTEEYCLMAVPQAYTNICSATGFVEMYRATSVTAFRTALEQWSFPAANVVFADHLGNIGYTANGAHPVRNPAGFLSGLIAQEGISDAYKWIELLPHDYKPWVLNPSDGFVFSANHMPIGSWYPLPRLFGGAGDSERSRRIRERLTSLAAGPPCTLLQVFDVHWDAVVPTPRDITMLAQHWVAQGNPISLLALSSLNELGPWLAAGGKIDGTHNAALLALNINRSIRSVGAVQAPASIVSLWGEGGSAMGAYLKNRITAINTGGQLTADDGAYIDALLVNAWTDTIALEPTVANWGAFYASNNTPWGLSNGLMARFYSWESVEGLNVPNTGTQFDYLVRARDSATILSLRGDVYTQRLEVGTVDGARSVLPMGQAEENTAVNSPYVMNQDQAWQQERVTASPTTPNGIATKVGIDNTIVLQY